MKRRRRALAVVGAALAWASAVGALPARGGGDPTLALARSNGVGPLAPGDSVVVQVRMRDLGMNEAAGFQAFLAFDTAKLSFVSATYPAAPFGLAIISPVVPSGGDIDLAAGIDVMNGQPPVSGDAVVAELTFTALEGSCAPAVEFREHAPATRLTTPDGGPILPLALVNPIRDCACDWNCDGVLNSQDFFDYVNDFLALSGEFNNDGVQNSQDFFDFLNCFFAAPPVCFR